MTESGLLNAEERADAQSENFLALLRELNELGLHVYSPEELYPQVNFNDPDSAKPRIDGSELIYDYQGRVYQTIFSGVSMYHHQLMDNNVTRRPLRRFAPRPTPPWREAARNLN